MAQFSGSTKKDGKSTRDRATNWSKAEEMELVEQVRVRISIIESSHSTESTNKKKNNAWSAVSEKVNQIGGKHRLVQDCKIKWKNLRAAVKKKYAALRRERSATGGGSNLVDELNETEQLVLSVIPQETLIGIDGGVDSFNQQSTATQSSSSSETETSQPVAKKSFTQLEHHHSAFTTLPVITSHLFSHSAEPSPTIHSNQPSPATMHSIQPSPVLTEVPETRTTISTSSSVSKAPLTKKRKHSSCTMTKDTTSTSSIPSQVAQSSTSTAMPQPQQVSSNWEDVAERWMRVEESRLKNETERLEVDKQLVTALKELTVQIGNIAQRMGSNSESAKASTLHFWNP